MTFEEKLVKTIQKIKEMDQDDYTNFMLKTLEGSLDIARRNKMLVACEMCGGVFEIDNDYFKYRSGNPEQQFFCKKCLKTMGVKNENFYS